METREKAYRYYKQIRHVFCPYLQTKVVFNSKGFRHLIYKNKKVKRDSKTQVLRFKLLSKAVKLLSITTTIQEEDSYKGTMSVKEYGVWMKKSKNVQYCGFIAIIDNWKIKVVVKRIGRGQYFFWSIIPNWVTNKKRDKGKNCVNFTGNMEED